MFSRYLLELFKQLFWYSNLIGLLLIHFVVSTSARLRFSRLKQFVRTVE